MVKDDAVSAYDDSKLLSNEIWWRSRYYMLEKRGYRLRQRYHPDWKPSWHTSGKSQFSSEDSVTNKHSKTLDATHMESGNTVVIKRIEKDSSEKRIALLMCSERMKDPRNHCVPIQDFFEDELELDTEFLVVPLLRPCFDPKFATVEEVLHFVQQTLEGVAFLHENDVAHRDCCELNIMFDAQKMYPKGFHASLPYFNTDASGPAPFVTRTAAGGVRYYLTDFGISTHFDDGKRSLILGEDCQDKTVPELSDIFPYDPFPVDIYTLGNLYREELIEKYKSLEFLVPLVESMTQKEPLSRPWASEALEKFESIVERLPIRIVKWKINQVKSHRLVHLYRNFTSLGPVCVAHAKYFLRPSSGS